MASGEYHIEVTEEVIAVLQSWMASGESLSAVISRGLREAGSSYRGPYQNEPQAKMPRKGRN